MTLTYINRRGKTSYLHEGKTKTGKPKFYFSQKSEGNLLNVIPDGYEIYENPNAQVFLRKIPHQLITPEEILLVKLGIESYAKMTEKRDFFLDVHKEKHLVVYFCNQNLEALTDLLTASDRLSGKNSAELLLQNTTYSPMMRFTLEDQESREFLLERWCFLPSVDDWITLEHNNLSILIEKYAQYLGHDSFVELGNARNPASKYKYKEVLSVLSQLI